MAESTAVKSAQEIEEKHLESLIGEPEGVEEQEPEKTEEAKTEDKKEGKEEAKEEPKEKQKRMVDYSALHEERQRRKEEKKRADDEAAARLKTEERMNELLKALKPQEELDPLTELQQRTQQLEATVIETTELQKKQLERAEKEGEFINRYRADANEYAKENPKFVEAYQHLIASRQKELSLFIKDPVKLQQALVNDERSIIEQAWENEENPAQVMYELAKERGFKEKTEEPEKKTDLKEAEKRANASKSLGTGGGGDSEVSLESLTAKELSAMSDKEFQALVKKCAPRGH